jgi:hypothetical protein
LGDAETLLALFDGAGFTAIEYRALALDLRFPSAAEYIERIVIGGAAAIPVFDTLDAREQARLIAAVRADVEPIVARHTHGAALIVPSETAIVRARKQEAKPPLTACGSSPRYGR